MRDRYLIAMGHLPAHKGKRVSVPSDQPGFLPPPPLACAQSAWLCKEPKNPAKDFISKRQGFRV